MAVHTSTSAFPNTYIRSRLDVLDDHFELFLRSSNMADSDVEKMLAAVERHELEAVGIYLEEGSYRISEVEFCIDWNKHTEMVRCFGNMFNTDIGGWKHGVAPEAYIPVQKLVKLATDRKLRVRSWIRVSGWIRANPQEHKRVCEELGYAFGSSVSPWKNPPKEKTRQISGLEEGRITARVGEG